MKTGALLVLTLVLAATGCGSSPGSQPEAKARPAASAPTWGGCQQHSMQTIDYVADAPGADTLADALEPYREPGDHLVHRPARAHRNAAWRLVDEHDVIRTAVEVLENGHGWLVSTVDRCDE